MLLGKIDVHEFIRVTGKNLTYLTESLARNDNFPVLVGITKFHISDRDPVSVKSDHSEPVISDLHELTGHHAAALISGN